LPSQVSESEPQLSPPGPHWQWASVQVGAAAGDSLPSRRPCGPARRGARPAGGPGPGPPRQAAVLQCRCCEGHAWVPVAAAGGGDHWQPTSPLRRPDARELRVRVIPRAPPYHADRHWQLMRPQAPVRALALTRAARTARHRAHTLLASSDAHPAAAHPAVAHPTCATRHSDSVWQTGLTRRFKLPLQPQSGEGPPSHWQAPNLNCALTRRMGPNAAAQQRWTRNLRPSENFELESIVAGSQVPSRMLVNLRPPTAAVHCNNISGTGACTPRRSTGSGN
jgi:hypothetical protein